MFPKNDNRDSAAHNSEYDMFEHGDKSTGDPALDKEIRMVKDTTIELLKMSHEVLYALQDNDSDLAKSTLAALKRRISEMDMKDDRHAAIITAMVMSLGNTLPPGTFER